ncbi:MAG TPA: glycine cleavage T C-terminal barrel domain-containing protein [Solirubrobacteraceae bacterium]|nr:glycine cleavage T C-terminal barrel domain-containing protein [Solirubrobacteraceae bacterium]
MARPQLTGARTGAPDATPSTEPHATPSATAHAATRAVTASAAAETLLEDYRAATKGCALLDRSERGKLALTGEGMLEFLNGQVTNELTSLRVGEGRYAAFLTHKGKMLGDLRILAVGDSAEGPPTELLLDSERVALQALFDMIRRFKVGFEVQLHKRTLERGLLSLIGPSSETVAAAAVAGLERLGDAEHDSAPVKLGALAALAVRTDVGIDFLCDSGETAALAGALSARGARPIAEQAAECVRVEHGRPRYGIDLDDSVIPQEAGLNERAVSFTKGCYVGQETVARLYYKGKPNRQLRGLRLSRPATRGEELVLGERVVGRVGSAVVSPALGPLALALVRREAPPGSVLGVGEQRASAEVVELPFANDRR